MIEILENALKGLETKGKALRVDESLFLEALGIDKQIEKASVDMTELETQLADDKETMAGLKKQKAEAVAETVDALVATINEALPEGKAIFTIDDSGIFLGWEVDGKVKPLHGLSGGERKVFEGALCHALKAELIIYEAAEADKNRLEGLMAQASGLKQQVIVNTWFTPGAVPQDWKVTNLA